MTDLLGKVILITGASSGIGAVVAKHFAKLGCKLCICGRNASNLEKTANSCVESGLSQIDIHLFIGDLTIDENPKKLIDSTIEKFGRLDVLINNASILSFGKIDDTSLETFDSVMTINVRVVYYLMQLAIPHLAKTQGSIINISSMCSLNGFTNLLAYSTSKAALDHLTRCTALELASKGIRVNCINPGSIITTSYERYGMTKEQYEKFVEKSKGLHALGRCGEPEEIANATEFLASGESSSFITGVNLRVDGGRSIVGAQPSI